MDVAFVVRFFFGFSLKFCNMFFFCDSDRLVFVGLFLTAFSRLFFNIFYMLLSL